MRFGVQCYYGHYPWQYTGLDWCPSDEILASDQEYGAIDNCLHLAERRRGVVVKRAQIPVSPERPEDILNAFYREVHRPH